MHLSFHWKIDDRQTCINSFFCVDSICTLFKTETAYSSGVRYLLGCYDMYCWSDIIWLESGGCGYSMEDVGIILFIIRLWVFFSHLKILDMTSLFFFGVLSTQLEDYFMKKKHLIRSGSDPPSHSTGCRRSYRGKHPSIFHLLCSCILERGGRCELQRTFNTENMEAWLMLLKTVKFELASFR